MGWGKKRLLKFEFVYVVVNIVLLFCENVRMVFFGGKFY